GAGAVRGERRLQFALQRRAVDEDHTRHVLPIDLARKLRIGEFLARLLRIHELDEDQREEEYQDPQRCGLGEAPPAGPLWSIFVAVSHVYFFRESAALPRERRG